jgi:hypothetical protein
VRHQQCWTKHIKLFAVIFFACICAVSSFSAVHAHCAVVLPGLPSLVQWIPNTNIGQMCFEFSVSRMPRLYCLSCMQVAALSGPKILWRCVLCSNAHWKLCLWPGVLHCSHRQVDIGMCIMVCLFRQDVHAHVQCLVLVQSAQLLSM